VTNMAYIFHDAVGFDQDLSGWDTSSVEDMTQMLSGSAARQCPGCGIATGSFAWLIGLWVLAIIIASVYILSVDMQIGFFYSAVRSAITLCQAAGNNSRLDALVTWEKVAFCITDPFRLGQELHRRVGPERWCITRHDLDLFEHEVLAAWKAGEIPNSTLFPNAYHDEPTVGPTIYQVNEYFIKPVTAQYGGMSFALMLHPEGLLCDTFATHAWQEGI